MPTSLGPAEILVILVVALIVLGPKRLPEAGRQVGKAIAEVRKWSQGFQDEIRSTIDPKPSYPVPPPGVEPSPIPMVPAQTGPAPELDAEPPPPAVTNGSAVPWGGFGAAPVPETTNDATNERASTDPSGPPAGEPPRT